MEVLPPELWCYVMEFLDCASVMAMREVCRKSADLFSVASSRSRRSAVLLGPWATTQVSMATTHGARSGNLPFLRWLRARGVPWDPNASQDAADCGNLDCFKFIYLTSTAEDYALDAARNPSHRPILDWLTRRGVCFAVWKDATHSGCECDVYDEDKKKEDSPPRVNPFFLLDSD